MTDVLSDERVRELYTMATSWHGLPDAKQEPHIVEIRQRLRAEWDAWLADHDRRVLAKARELVDSTSPFGEDVPAAPMREALGMEPLA